MYYDIVNATSCDAWWKRIDLDASEMFKSPRQEDVVPMVVTEKKRRSRRNHSSDEDDSQDDTETTPSTSRSCSADQITLTQKRQRRKFPSLGPLN